MVNPSQCRIALPVSHLYCHWLILPPPHPPGLAPLLLFQHTLKNLCMWVAHTYEHGWWWITLTRHCCLLLCHYYILLLLLYIINFVFINSVVMNDETPATNHQYLSGPILKLFISNFFWFSFFNVHIAQNHYD